MFLLFLTLSIADNKTSLAYDIGLLNKDTNAYTHELVHKPIFYSIVLDLNKPCASENIKNLCKTDNCKRPSILDNNQVAPTENFDLFIDMDGTRIDLRKVAPQYTGYKEGAQEIWKNIYKIAKDLKRLVSGIHFSTSVYMAKNYKKDDDGKYFSSLELYKKKYKEEYETNLYLTFVVVRSAVLRLKFAETSELVSLLKEQGDVKKIRWKDLFVNYEQFFDTASQYLDCIECGTCKLWGNIQFKGLKAAIDILKDKKITKEEMVYLINFFNKISTTIETVQLFNHILIENENKGNKI